MPPRVEDRQRAVGDAARDDESRPRAEELQAQKLESLGRLAASVAHEYNNFLTVILSCGHALTRAAEQRQPVPEDEVRQLNAAAERAQELTRGLLAFARRQVSDPVPLDLGELAERAKPMLSRLLGEDVRLEVARSPDLWPVRADPGQLDQVLMNLAANARDALPRGGRVTIATANLALEAADAAWPDLPPGAYVELSVADDGVGITPELQGRIFDPFFSTKRKGQGTGLGLATVQGVVARCGGRVRVESVPGRGTRFLLAFPRCHEPVRRASASLPEAEPMGGTETILLVEDDPGVRRQALRALAGAGYQVHVAADGEEALALALAPAPHLLLTDVVLPGVDGPRLAADLRARWPGLRVLFTSGYEDDRLPVALADAGAREFLPKPFTVAALLSKVRAVLDAGTRPTR